ncbi:TPA: DUF1837 domain-containing protein [Klebsiella pneumoniae]|uniref:HamA C-terminal domain-containing protein n=10 Tax=Gammaproteobacteria TaxID=1236 RepID=UPI001D0D49E0|nr:DUF1837 domain-containing protein [Klebsiella pneumoniae]MCE7460768.1 DUF1837 domain-containing protein [Klebsiella pneumoniae]
MSIVGQVNHAVNHGNFRGSIVGLYEKWCDSTKEQEQRKYYWIYVEKDGGRDDIRDDLAEIIRSHYDRLERIVEDVSRLGYKVAAKILSEAMPQTSRSRSGDLGEILATELVEEEIGLRVPVRRLRYKDGRNMAMRGDDFIGAGYDGNGEKLWLLKGEAKSNRVLGKATVTSARKVLNRDNGRCTPDSLLFVANRLLESQDPDDNELGRSLRDEVGLKLLPADRIDHMLFTMSGNGPHASLKKDLDATSTNRDHYVVNIHIEDHQDFIAAMYQEAEDLGDD